MPNLDALNEKTFEIMQIHAELLHVRGQVHNLGSNDHHYQQSCNALRQSFTEVNELLNSNNGTDTEVQNIMQSLTNTMLAKEQQWYADKFSNKAICFAKSYANVYAYMQSSGVHFETYADAAYKQRLAYSKYTRDLARETQILMVEREDLFTQLSTDPNNINLRNKYNDLDNKITINIARHTKLAKLNSAVPNFIFAEIAEQNTSCLIENARHTTARILQEQATTAQRFKVESHTSGIGIFTSEGVIAINSRLDSTGKLILSLAKPRSEMEMTDCMQYLAKHIHGTKVEQHPNLDPRYAANTHSITPGQLAEYRTKYDNGTAKNVTHAADRQMVNNSDKIAPLTIRQTEKQQEQKLDNKDISAF
ncbi:MAG: hypothetical protein COB50_04585 [Thiotrichales bacterium]|nr:MAG: hypothetical protein COB50_04585 [Thiotrichales bacterium]